MRLLIDEGFANGSPELLVRSLLVFLAMVLALALGTFVRFYLVSWVGERVSADLRRAVFDHVITLHPGFFEDNYASEIQSRITTDTTLLQTVIGSSVSIALRNALMFLGGLVLLVLTNPRLSLFVVIAAPLVVAPIILFGRRVRRLSRCAGFHCPRRELPLGGASANKNGAGLHPRSDRPGALQGSRGGRL